MSASKSECGASVVVTFTGTYETTRGGEHIGVKQVFDRITAGTYDWFSAVDRAWIGTRGPGIVTISVLWEAGDWVDLRIAVATPDGPWVVGLQWGEDDSPMPALGSTGMKPQALHSIGCWVQLDYYPSQVLKALAARLERFKHGAVVAGPVGAEEAAEPTPDPDRPRKTSSYNPSVYRAEDN